MLRFGWAKQRSSAFADLRRDRANVRANHTRRPGPAWGRSRGLGGRRRAADVSPADASLRLLVPQAPRLRGNEIGVARPWFRPPAGTELILWHEALKLEQ